MTQAVALAQQASTGVSQGFKNKIINGNMLIWQRGTSGSSGYVADRWFINSSNTTVAQSTDVPTGFRFSTLMTATSAANAQITQRIESFNCNDFVSQPITISFWAKSTSGSTQLGAYISSADVQDTYGATTQIGSTQTFTLTSTWTRYSTTITNSAPAAAANGIQFGLFRSGTESSVTYITGVQLEVGSTATSFDYRPYGTELALCQRYCINYRSADAGTFMRYGSGYANSTTNLEINVHFPVTMRTNPSLTTTATAANYSIYIGGGQAVCSTLPVIDSASDNPSVSTVNANSASTFSSSGGGSIISAANTTSYMLFTAEL